MNVAVRSDDRFTKVDGVAIRYLEEGSGVPALLLHGNSLGSSADVFAPLVAAERPTVVALVPGFVAALRDAKLAPDAFASVRA